MSYLFAISPIGAWPFAIASILGRMAGRHRYHLLVILSAPVISVILMIVKLLNPIYSATIGMTVGFFATLYCRTDLWLKMVVSGVLFFLLYFIAFALFNVAFPGYVAAVWNLKAVSGLLVGGVPLEELIFAFTFGLYWSSTYEHLTWRRNRPSPNSLEEPCAVAGRSRS